MNEVITYPSTVNGGTTIVLPSSKVACQVGQAKYDKYHEEAETADLKQKVQVTTSRISTTNRKAISTRSKTVTLKHYYKMLFEQEDRYKNCCQAVMQGNPFDDSIKEEVKQFADHLVEVAMMIEPGLSNNEGGWGQSEQGPIADPALIGSGAANPCFQRRHDGEESRDGEGDGAYRIIICTDQPWFGNKIDNAGVVLALIAILQQFRPVELWIQQGWLGHGDANGVTLFKLECEGGVDPTQLIFWTSNPEKDSRFSRDINDEMGRDAEAISHKAEMPCDLFLMGAWMKLYGIEQGQLGEDTKEQRLKKFGQYIVDTTKSIAYGGEE